MNKNGCPVTPLLGHKIIKTLFIMKLTISLILLTALQAMSKESNSQKRIDLDLKNQSIVSVLNIIESKFEYRFLYNDALGLDDTKVDVYANKATIDYVMQQLLQNSSFSYKKINKSLLVITGYDDNGETVVIPFSGKVTDEKGEPLSGVSIIEKGTDNGVTTGDDGSFTMDIVSENAILVVSSVGFVTQEIAVKDMGSTIVLYRETQKMDEVVVVGYGQQRKVNLTGSVSSINMTDVTKGRPVTNISRGIAGLAAGVYVNAGNNRPSNDNSTILIRGQGTLNSSAPFVVIDGVEGNLYQVNPNDIETISILKDAASSAIYGSRAANGVILITTKKGKTNQVSFSYGGFVSLESVANTIEPVSNYSDYMKLLNEGFTNSGQPKKFSNDMINKWRAMEGTDSANLEYPNVDWRKAVLRSTTSTTHNFSVSGGSDKVTFYTSFLYNNNSGIIENSGVRRYDLRANVDAKIKKWLTIGTMLNGNNTNVDLGARNLNTLFTYAAASTPGYVLRSADGRYGAVSNTEDNAQANNVLLIMNSEKGEDKAYNAFARFYTVLNPVKDFSITGSFTYKLGMEKITNQPVFIDRWNFLGNSIAMLGANRSYLGFYTNQRVQHFMDIAGTYEHTFFHNFNVKAMAGASQEQFQYQNTGGTKYDLLDPSLSVFDAATGEASLNGIKTEWAMRSFFGRLNVVWADKYLAEFNLRSDGSSKFLNPHRWGYFPSASVGWRIDRENFMQHIVNGNILNSLKIRASYGALGNNSVGDYEAQSLYGTLANNPYNSQLITNSANYILNGMVQQGLTKLAIANAILTWEKTILTDVGLDFGMLNNKLTGVVDYFHKKTVGILIDLPAPLVHGTTALPKQNVGEVLNTGLEFSLEWRDRIAQNFSYYVKGNAAFIKNKVLKFKGDQYALVGGNGMIKEGVPIQAQYVRIVDRIVQTPEDLALVQKIIDNAPKDNTGNTLNPFPYGIPAVGDILYKDLNKDGIINDNDRQVIGNGPNPTFMYGVSLGAEFKGFDFSALIQGVNGIKMFYNDAYYTTNVRYGYQLNKEVMIGRWYPGRETPASFPRLMDFSNTKNVLPSDMWMVDKSYLKIRNIQLGYTFPKSLLTKTGLVTFRIYSSLENYFTLTTYPGIDPEVNGMDYPSVKQAVFGLNITF